jgi:branched-chain amino acid transport system permease protein
MRSRTSRVGRAWEATREDEDAAELMGVPTFRYKLLAFALGPPSAGWPARCCAGQSGFISPQTLPAAAVDAVRRRGRSSAGRQPVGCDRRRRLVAYLPERFRDCATTGC